MAISPSVVVSLLMKVDSQVLLGIAFPLPETHMIAPHRSLLFVAVLMAGCNDPTGVVNEPPAEPAFAKGGSGNTSVLLPTLGGTFSEARAVNDGGVVVGFSTDNSGTFFAVRWTRTLSGSWSVTSIAGADSRAFAINANGAAVGVRAQRGKLWPAAGGEIDLGPGNPGGINSDETVIGYRTDPVLHETAVVWRKPGTGWAAENPSQDLPPFSGGATGRSQAFAINDAGVISGSIGVSTATSSFYAVRWDPVGDQWGEPTALPGTESFSSTTGRAINDNADIAGHVRECQQFCSAVGIFWPIGSSPTNLESFFGSGSGWVEGINNAQRLVGFHTTRNGRSAFVWWPGRTSLQDLGGPGGYGNTWAHDINNLSPAQAVGNGYGPNPSRTRAIVWTIQ